jgi:phosphoglycolate phosphatase
LTGRALPRGATPLGGFKLVIFDYDGTLFDTRAAIVHCIGRSLEQSGRGIPPRDVVAASVGTGATLPDTLRLLDPGLCRDKAVLEELVVTYRRLYRDEAMTLLCTFPGVTDTLRDLRSSGVTCTVVSNKGIDAIRRSFDETGLSEFIDFVIGDQPGIPKKPDPSLVLDLIVPRYGFQCDEMLIVGDTEVDIRFARATGIASCWASYGYGRPADCRALGPDYEISNIGDLRDVVAQGNPRRLGQTPL